MTSAQEDGAPGPAAPPPPIDYSHPPSSHSSHRQQRQQHPHDAKPHDDEPPFVTAGPHHEPAVVGEIDCPVRQRPRDDDGDSSAGAAALSDGDEAATAPAPADADVSPNPIVFDGLTAGQVHELRMSDRAERWGFTEAELTAATKVTRRLSSEYELFVGDPVLAATGIMFSLNVCARLRRRFPTAHGALRRMRRKAAALEARSDASGVGARTQRRQASAAGDQQLAARTHMKRDRGAAMAKAMDGYNRTVALEAACAAALTDTPTPEAVMAAHAVSQETHIARRKFNVQPSSAAPLQLCSNGTLTPIQQRQLQHQPLLAIKDKPADPTTLLAVGSTNPNVTTTTTIPSKSEEPSKETSKSLSGDHPVLDASKGNDTTTTDLPATTVPTTVTLPARLSADDDAQDAAAGHDEDEGEDDDVKAHGVLSALQPGEEAFYSRSRRCYVCKKPFRRVHFFYHAMCEKCAAFNHAKRGQTRELAGKVVVLTGCRIKIGFAMALLLLRCGATLVGTTRFPTEARARFMQEADYGAWAARLHLFALDMRDLPVVHHFCAFLEHTFPQGIFALINNAAQTIARPPGYFAAPLKVEAAPPAPCVAEAARDGAGVQWAQVHAQCARLRPGEAAFAPAITGDAEANAPTAGVAPPVVAITRPTETIDGDEEDEDATAAPAPPAAAPASVVAAPAGKPAAEAAVYDRYDFGAEVMDTRSVNSWVMRLTDVPCGEALEVMLINAIAPMVLCARLRPLLAKRSALETAALERGVEVGVRKSKGKCAGGPDGAEGQPEERATKTVYDVRSAALAGAVEKRFVVNVSAMEGQFYRMKQATHPHTNMAKAALNMMTRTSAVDYLGDGIFMNAVDTGWVTDEAPRGGGLSVEQRQALRLDVPLDEVDGAMRCLDPILADSARYGKFLKDYQETLW